MKKILLILFYMFLSSCSVKNSSLDGFDIEKHQKEKIENFFDVLFSDTIENIRTFMNVNEIEVDIVDRKGKSLLLLALLDENFLLAEKLLKLGADPNGSESAFKRMSLVGWAASYKNDKFLSLLLKYGGDPNLISKGEWPASTPIFEAIRVNNKTNVELLINSGANLNVEARGGFTPLMLAAAIGKWELLYLLLNSDSDYMYVNKFGKTVLTYIEIQGLGVDGEEGRWREKVFSFLKDDGVILTPRVPL